ncbi:MAG: TldD/PmbA family protein [Clostridia bacterium]|nr:TldD/PmbA family protein [Clostridia bacterium]
MKSIASQVLDLAKKKGAEIAEIFLLDSQELTIEVAKQEVENLKLAEEQGLGLRVISGNRLGYAYSADLSKESLRKTVEKAVHNSRLVAEDSAWDVAKPGERYAKLDLYDPEISEKHLEEKISLAQELEKAALATDSRVRQVEKAVYQDSVYRVSIFNSLGLEGNYQGSFCGLYGVAIGQEGEDAQTGFSMDFTLQYKELNPIKVGREAGKKAVQMLGGQTMPSAKLPVVLDPYVMVGILGVLQAAFSGEAVLKGTSFLAGKEGEKVASPLVRIIDHGALNGRLGSSPFDSEGTPTGETVLIKDGKLQGFLHNLYTARKTGVTSTGNAVRASYKSTPEVGTTNFYLEQGSVSRQELLGEIKQGLYVTEVMGLHTANSISGDFSLGAAGLLIENGELTSPIKGVALAGNLQDLLMGIDAVADDLTFYVGQGAPTVRIQGLTISGK